jgi:cytochrome c556
VDALPVGALGETERRTFTALASRLQWQAEALTERAAGDATPETEARLEEITETCAACHALFRPAPRPD